MSDDDMDYLFEDNKPVWVDFLSMVPADILAAHDAEVAAKARQEALEEAARVADHYRTNALVVAQITHRIRALIDAPTTPEGEQE